MRHGQRHDEFDSTSERHLRGYSVSAFSERAYQFEGSVWIRRAKPVKNSVKLFSQLRQIRPDEIAMSADSENKGGLVRCEFQDRVFVLLTHRFCLINQTTKLQGTCCAINFRGFSPANWRAWAVIIGPCLMPAKQSRRQLARALKKSYQRFRSGPSPSASSLSSRSDSRRCLRSSAAISRWPERGRPTRAH